MNIGIRSTTLNGLATESIRYLTYAEAVTLHIMLMRRMGEIHFGVFDRSLVVQLLVGPGSTESRGCEPAVVCFQPTLRPVDTVFHKLNVYQCFIRIHKNSAKCLTGADCHVML